MQFSVLAAAGLVVPPVFLYLFFFFYASAVRHWKKLPLLNKVVVGSVIVVFAVLDVAVNLTWGSLYYLDLNVLHGAPWWSVRAWTFSDRSCYWFNDLCGWRYRNAKLIADELDPIYPGHIS